MPDLDLRINPFMADALVHIIEAIGRDLESILPQGKGIPVTDPELAAGWREGLREEQEHDVMVLLHLLKNRNFGRAKVTMDEESAECVLRACAAVRLKIQTTLLAEVPGESLETGEVAVMHLPAEQQRGYACYLFLATVQALLLRELDPSLDGL